MGVTVCGGWSELWWVFGWDTEGLERWGFSESKGGFWDGLEVCGVGNFGRGGDGFWDGLKGCFGCCWVSSGSGMGGEGLLDVWGRIWDGFAGA